MPGLWTSFKNMFRRKSNQLAEAMADPAGDADLHVEDAKRKADDYQSRVASAIAQNKRLEIQQKEMKEEAKKYERYADKAAAAGDDENATKAIEKQVQAEERSGALSSDIKKNNVMCDKLRKELDRIRAKVSTAEANKEILKARLASGQMRKELARARTEFSSNDSLAALDNLNKAALKEETEADAFEELAGNTDEDLEEKYGSASSKVEEKLAKLKAKHAK